MATVTAEPASTPETFADLLEQLGGIPPERVMLRPTPGTATEKDVVVAMELPRKRLCELVDGVLVEKAMGTKEGLLAGLILYLIWNFLDQYDRGLALPGDSAARLKIGLVRIPDVCFISWDRLPGGELPDEAIAGVIPNLAVEVLSKSNTPKEMERKLREYFQAGVQLVWLIEPKTQTARVYSSPTKMRRINKDQALDGGEVLPGFVLPLKELFSRGRRRKRKSR
jgi:Uma2 family endonuclease